MTCLFSILGPTRVRTGTRLEESWAAPKTRGMLGALLTNPGSWFTTAELVDWMWAEDDRLPRNIPQTFYNYAGRIRHTVEAMKVGVELHTRKGAYRLAAPRASVDYFLAIDLLDRTRQAREPREAVRAVRDVVDQWTGAALADLPGEAAAHWRRRAHEHLWLPLHNVLCEKLLACDDFHGVIAHVDSLPSEAATHLTLVMRRLEAMKGLNLGSELDAYYFGMRRRLQEEFEDAAAATLKNFYEGLAEPRRVELRERRAGARGRLPHGVEDFVGRDALLAKIDAVTGCATGNPRPGLVLLEGAAGVGKTALALRWAHRVVDLFPDGVLHCDLKGFSADQALDASVVVDRFLEVLGVDVDHLPTAERRARRLESTLDDRRVLVVLDNARGLPQVAALFPLLRACTVLVTSRNRLPGMGPRSFPVAPLDTTDAVRMFEGRVGGRAVRDRSATHDLVALCGGLPLAIDIVAHRIAASPGAALREFVAQLRDERRLLDLGNQGDTGDVSLKTVFSWSYRALSPPDRRAFRLLGLHPGGEFSTDAVTALLGTGKTAALDCLELLASAHLLEQPGSLHRYHLHDLLHDYAEACVQAEEPDDERRLAELRLVDFYLHSAKAADSVAFAFRPGVPVDEPASGVVPLDFAHDRAAQDWFIAERANLCAVIDLAARRGLHAHVAKLAHVVTDMFRRCGYYEEARSMLALAVGSAQLEGDADGEAAAYSDLGLVCFQQREFFEARKHVHRAHLMARWMGSDLGIAVSLHLLARIDVEEGEVEEGVRRYHEVLRIVREASPDGSDAGLAEIEAGTLHRLGVLAMAKNNRVDAATFLHRALYRRERLGNPAGEADTLGELAELHRMQGELRTAQDYADRAIGLHLRTRDQAVAARCCQVLAMIHRDRHDVVAATHCARRAVQLYDRVGNSKGKAEALVLLGELRWSAKEHAAAGEAWEQAFKIFADAGDPRARAVAVKLNPFDDERTVPTTRVAGWSDRNPDARRETRQV